MVYKAWTLIFLFLTPPTWASQVLSGQDLVSGKIVQLVQPSTKPAVVVFMSARCPCSASHEGVIRDLAAQFREFHFLAVHANANESEAEAKAHFEKANLGIPVIEDDKGLWAARYQALKTPHAFLINREGQVVYSGGVTDSSEASNAQKAYLKDTLIEFQQTGQVKEPHRRALGCIIKRRKS